MSSLDILIILAAVTAFSLIIVSLSNQRAKKRRAQQLRLNALKRRILHLETLVIEIDPLLESHLIPRLLNDEILSIVAHVRAIDAGTTQFDSIYQTAFTRADALLEEGLSAQLDRLKESDVKIAKSLKHLQETAIAIRQLKAANKISLEEMREFLNELGWAQLMINVISYVGQGHKAVRRKDLLSAHAFYKKAQLFLMKSNHPDPRKRRFIKEIAELMSGKRAAISEDLMPESHLNPQ